MTPGRLLWLARRDWQRGWKASFNAYFVANKIFNWRMPELPQEKSGIPVHVLTSGEDHVLSAWMLASWIHFTGRRWTIVLHEDGTLSAKSQGMLHELFPGLKIITRIDADRSMEKILESRLQCSAYRKKIALGLKIFDMAALESNDRFIILDSDVLFFRPPTAILDWCADASPSCWFNADVAEASTVSADEVTRKLGVKLWPRVNSGICLLQRKAIDLDFCERVLAETTAPQGKLWRIEQTLFALCASRGGQGGLLPSEYEVSLGRTAAPGVIARHYVGAVRQLFYGEGMARLKKELLGP